VDEAQDNAACMALSRWAQLAGPYPGSGIPANQYEAENAIVHHINLEAIYGDFTGWGYLAGWNGDGSWVDFPIICATAGPHDLLFRYAAGAGDASRLLKVNGGVLVTNQIFANTGAWSSYSTVKVSCNLPAGPSTVSVLFESGQLSANWLNLDNLTVLGDAPEEIQISALSVSPAGNVRLSWNSRIGETYRVQFRNWLSDDVWNDLGGPLFASGTNMTTTDTVGTNLARYYRISQP
jgi:hypothetical protein